MLLLFVLSITLMTSQLSYGWDSTFKFNACYQRRMDERMPLSIDNLIAIIEKYERTNQNTSPEDVANAILNRYHTNGVTYNPAGTQSWSVYQTDEVNKQDLDDKLLKTSQTIEQDAFFPREECSLHMMISHSTDLFPHAGVDYMWENNGYNYGRQKRDVVLPSDTDPATHPVEFGVIQTTAGPVAGGLMLAGIMSATSSSSYTVGSLIGTNEDQSYMPQEMTKKTVEQLYGVTVSGELGQSALLSGSKASDFDIGPAGRFGNCTSCSRAFSLENTDYSHFSRAEVYGSLDGLIIAQQMKQASSSQRIKLSEILRMYYGNHGLFNEDIRACNRHRIYRKFQNQYKTILQDQALNYMYVLQNYYPDLKTLVGQYKEDFNLIEKTFNEYLTPVFNRFNSFLTSSVSDYSECISRTQYEIQPETQADLIVVFTPTNSQTDNQKQAEYIALTARRIGVGYQRSRVAVLNGRTERWVAPLTNHSNIADYACNYTTLNSFIMGSTQNFLKVLDQLTVFYYGLYTYIRADPSRTGRNSQVVMWNLPTKFSENEYDMAVAWNTFNLTYPDVSFIFVGNNNGQLPFLINDYAKNDVKFVSSAPADPALIAAELVQSIITAPRTFVYPACDINNSSYTNYNEGSHLYTMYVSPNFTTTIQISPQNFRFSEYVKLMFKGNDVRVCLSRVNKIPRDTDTNGETLCDDSPFEYQLWYPCGRYLEECAAIYVAVSGNADYKGMCSDEACQFPNQIKFEMNHEGMICGCWGILPTPLLLMVLLLAHFFRL